MTSLHQHHIQYSCKSEWCYKNWAVVNGDEWWTSFILVKYNMNGYELQFLMNEWDRTRVNKSEQTILTVNTVNMLTRMNDMYTTIKK